MQVKMTLEQQHKKHGICDFHRPELQFLKQYDQKKNVAHLQVYGIRNTLYVKHL